MICLGNAFDGGPIIPAGDYVVVLEAGGTHAKSAFIACVLGDKSVDSGMPGEPYKQIIFKQLPKSIGQVLGDGHWLAKEFDQRTAQDHPTAN